MKKKLLAQLLLLFFLQQLNAQQGYHYLQNYSIPLPKIENANNNSIVQSTSGCILIANTKGVINYNGSSWEYVQTPSSPYVLYADEENDIVYVGCSGEFGYLEKDNRGTYMYHSIETDFEEPVKSIIKKDKWLGFTTEREMFMVSTDYLLTDVRLRSNDSASIGTAFFLNDDLYAVMGNRLYQKHGKEFALDSWIEEIAGNEVIASASLASDKVVLASSTNELYVFDGLNISRFNSAVEEYIAANKITSLFKMEEILAVGTLTGGTVLIDQDSRQSLGVINYQSGLPDDAILTMGKDKLNGLWICHGLGVSRVDFDLPVKNFSTYPGLEGVINSVEMHNDKLYVGTTEGLFVLTQVMEYDDVAHYVRKLDKVSTQVQTFRTTKTVKKSIKVTFNTVDPVSKKKVPVVKNIPIKIDVPVDSVATTTMRVFTNQQVRKAYIRQSIPYVYKKMKGFDGRCLQLMDAESELLALGDNGLYTVDSAGTRLIDQAIRANFIFINPENRSHLFLAHSNGITKYNYNAGQWFKTDSLTTNSEVFNITQKENNLWLGSTNQIYRISFDATGKMGKQPKRHTVTSSFDDKIITINLANEVYGFSSYGIYRLDAQKDTFINDPVLEERMDDFKHITFKDPQNIWLKTIDGWRNGIDESLHLPYLNLFSEINDLKKDEDNFWLITNNEIYQISEQDIQAKNADFRVLINEVKSKADTLLSHANIRLPYNENSLSLAVSSNFFIKEDNMLYQYKLDNEEWSGWLSSHKLDFPYLPAGNYDMTIRAKNVLGAISNPATLSFYIKEPFWKRLWFYVLITSLLVLAALAINQLRIMRLSQMNLKLKKKVDMATYEIIQQRDKIKHVNDEITSSIRYARLIQQAMLPDQRLLKDFLPQSFIIYRPRNIVSGDFYWLYGNKEEFILISADCTGHGVPGAFMSMIGNTLLNKIIREDKVRDPSHILNNLNEEVKANLHQNQQDSTLHDGMDLSVCRYVKAKEKLYFAAANSSMVYFENGEAQRLRGDRLAIGGFMYEENKEKEFTTQTVPVKGPMEFYIYSDGYPDQNGGPDDKKITTKRFINLLRNIHEDDMAEQQHHLEENLDDWMKGYTQRDDILVIGFRINP